ncbi:substrate-binding domain-containing protein [Nocardiopsis sp. LOL_012]|uniref:substrate-binding domain-containing protein n=1 Tax=Nocardiopsis sp. LOL_012 TaxID=3345409 RepID=UPI003A84F81A
MGRHRGRYAEEPYPPSRGRGRRRRGRARGGAVAALATALVIVVALAVAGVYMFDQTDGCRGADIELDIAASPELAPALDTLATEFNAKENTVDGRCVAAEVRQVDSANVAFGISGAGATMGDTDSHVWIPDSSVWPDLVRSRSDSAVITETGTSVARSPLVLAQLNEFASEQTASWTDVAPSGTPGQYGNTVRMVDPTRSSSGMSALYLMSGALEQASPDTDTYNALMTGALQALQQSTSPDEDAAFVALSGGTEEAPPLMVMSEQAVWRYNNTHRNAAAQAGYVEGGTAYLDYPYVMRSDDPQITRASELFREAVRSEAFLPTLLSHGFRGPEGQIDSSVLTVDAGFRQEAPPELPSPSDGSATDLIQTWNQMKMDSRVLTIVDISGSMLAEVPETGMTRIQVTSAATVQGLEFFPPTAEMGLWQFSTDIDGDLDYEEVNPVLELQSPGEGGGTHREAISTALSGLEPLPRGDTGLYDSLLAAYKEMVDLYTPDRNNVILVLTDGDNDNPDGIDLETLLTELDAVSDPARPIPVFTIAFGPDVEHLEPLQEIGAATGGAAYMTEDPTEISDIFLKIFSHRISGNE